MYEKTSPGLIQLIKRHGLKPTGNPSKDIKLARAFMPAPYKVSTNEKNKKK